MVGDSSTRTVPIKLDVDESAANLLHQTTDHFLDAANYVVDVAWKPDWKITSKQKLHDQTYYDVRDESPLPANLVQAARNRAAEAVKGCVERWKKARKPRNHTSRHGSPATTQEPARSTTTTPRSPPSTGESPPISSSLMNGVTRHIRRTCSTTITT